MHIKKGSCNLSCLTSGEVDGSQWLYSVPSIASLSLGEAGGCQPPTSCCCPYSYSCPTSCSYSCSCPTPWLLLSAANTFSWKISVRTRSCIPFRCGSMSRRRSRSRSRQALNEALFDCAPQVHRKNNYYLDAPISCDIERPEKCVKSDI